MTNWSNIITYSITGEGETVYPKESGVYVIAENIGGTNFPRYVGKSDEGEGVRNRMARHRENNEPNIELKKLMQYRIDNVRVRFIVLTDPENIANLEHTLVIEYRLENLYNQVIPDGDTFQNIELPF